MVMSVYPDERAAILRIRKEQKLKSTFDVVRAMADGTAGVVKPGDFRAAKRRS